MAINVNGNKPLPPPVPAPEPKQVAANPPATEAKTEAKNEVKAPAVKDAFDTAKTATLAGGAGVGGAVAALAGAISKKQAAPTAPEIGDVKKADAKPVGELPPGKSGEDKAKEQLEIQTVGKDRTGIEDVQKSLKSETASKSDELFDMADGKKDLPPNTEAKKLSDNQVELVRQDDKGEVLERTLATRGKDGAVSLDSSLYRDGMNRREKTEVMEGGGTRVQNAEWKSDKNETKDMMSFDDIGKSRDTKFTYNDSTVSTKDDTLTVDQYSQKDGAVSGSRTDYFKQDGGKGIDDKLKDDLDFKKPIDRADTFTYSIPAPKDGKQGDPTYQRTQRFAQENFQTTSVVDTALKDETRVVSTGRGGGAAIREHFYKDNVKNEPHNREDFAKVRDHNVKNGFEKRFDANEAQDKGQPPKRWFSELKKGPDELRTQTGIEGFPKATVVTDRKRDGNTVTEKYAGKTFKPDSKNMNDLVDVGGESSQTYAKDGSLEKSDLKRVNADGSKDEQHYKSSTEQTKEGLVHHESTESKYTKEGKTSSMLKEDKSRINSEGVQLLGTKTTMTGTDGKQAISSLDEKGEKLTVTGPDGKDPRDIEKPENFQNDADAQDLALKAATSTVETTKAYVDHVGVKALDALEYIGDKAGNPPLPKAMGKVFDAQKLNDSLTEVRDARLGANVASHALGAATGAMKLAAGIRSGNKEDIIMGAVGTAPGAIMLGSDLYTAFNRLRGMPHEMGMVDKLATPALESLGRTGSAGASIAKTVEKMGGASRAMGAVVGPGLDIATGALDIKNGVEGGHTGQIAKGAVGIVGGVAGMAAAIALSGPAAVVVAPLIGVGTAIIGGIIEAITDDKHQISELDINNHDFEVKPPDYEKAAPAPPPPPTPEEKKKEEAKERQQKTPAWRTMRF